MRSHQKGTQKNKCDVLPSWKNAEQKSRVGGDNESPCLSSSPLVYLVFDSPTYKRTLRLSKDQKKAIDYILRYVK